MDQDLLEVTVKGLTFDPVTNVPIVILKETNGKRMLPIWIGVFEANAIALEMEVVGDESGAGSLDLVGAGSEFLAGEGLGDHRRIGALLGAPILHL